jgi:hypothetical protein
LAGLATATKQNVSDEMRHELAFENHRWTDLIRNNRAIDVIKAKGIRLKRFMGGCCQAPLTLRKTGLFMPSLFAKYR